MSPEITTDVLPAPFDRLVGSWRIQRHVDTGNGVDRMLEGEVVFASMFGGHAAQDLWTVPHEDAWCDAPPDGGFRGTTIYYFGDVPGVVHSVWIDPDRHVSLRFSGEMGPAGFVLTSGDDTIHARWLLQLTTESTATWQAFRSDSRG